MGKLMLLIEDAPVDVLLVKRALGRVPLGELQVVRSAQQGREYLLGVGEYGDREKYRLPDIILLDLTLPDESGLSFLKWRSSQGEETRVTPVIVITGQIAPWMAAEAHVLGASCVLIKHMDPTVFESHLRMLFETLQVCEVPNRDALANVPKSMRFR